MLKILCVFKPSDAILTFIGIRLQCQSEITASKAVNKFCEY